MDLEKNKQRIEILAAEIEELKNGGGGGDLSAYLTKEEASSTYETQTSASSALALKADKSTTYTKTEVDEAIAAAAGGDVVVDGNNVKTKNAGLGKGILIGNQAGFNSTAAYNDQIAIGTRAGITNPSSGNWPIAIGYQASGKSNDIVIGSGAANEGNGTLNTLVGTYAKAKGTGGISIGYLSSAGDSCTTVGYDSGGLNVIRGIYVGGGCKPKFPTDTGTGQIAIGDVVLATGDNAMGFGRQLRVNTNQVVLGKFNVESNTQNCLIIGNGTDDSNRSNLIEITTPFKVSTAGIEVNGTPYGQTATSTATLPSAGTGTTFDTGIEWSYIQTKNDFILDSEGSQIKFRYGFTKGSKLHYFGYILDSDSTTRIAHLELGAPTGSGTTALATLISSGAIPTT